MIEMSKKLVLCCILRRGYRCKVAFIGIKSLIKTTDGVKCNLAIIFMAIFYDFRNTFWNCNFANIFIAIYNDFRNLNKMGT